MVAPTVFVRRRFVPSNPPKNQNLNDYRSVEFSGLVAPENCREYGFGYGVVYLTKNDMATLK